MKLNERSVAYYATSDSPPDKTGFLVKKGERNTAYHRRWFVLKGNMLFYFEERESREPIGLIVLEGCTVELCESTEEFAFAIKFDCAKARVYKMAAENQAAMESWVKALSRASFDYMRLVVKELEMQLEEIQEAGKGDVVAAAPGGVKSKSARRGQLSRSRSGASSSSSSSSTSSCGALSAAAAAAAVFSSQRSVQEDPLLPPGPPGPLRENGVAWSKPGSALTNGVGEGPSSGAPWDGGPGGEGTRPPPVPPRRRGASLESPVSPGTGCFSKLHEWYGLEVEQLRGEWLLSQ